MGKLFALSLAFSLLAMPAFTQSNNNRSIAFCDPSFPAVDTAAISVDQIAKLVSEVQCVGAEQLDEALGSDSSRLLVLPYGSAFPENSWPAIHAYLKRGGNLLVVGGMPFTRAAYREGASWKVRDYSVRFSQELMIDQYHPTPGSAGLTFETNSEIAHKVSAFQWTRAFSPVIRLSESDIYERDGSTGFIDATLTPLAWGVRDRIRVAAPAIEIDHLQGEFRGGRWVFIDADLSKDFAANAGSQELIRGLAELAARGAELFIAEPVLPLYHPGEPVAVRLNWQSPTTNTQAMTAHVQLVSERSNQVVQDEKLAAPATISLRSPQEPGLYYLEAELLRDNTVRALYHSAFWIRDGAYLRSGSKLSVNADYFEVDGRPLAVVGTTYMASDVQRLFFNHPNVYVWNRDMRQISSAGMNMIRTGWWTGWDRLVDENGQPTERTLRTLEAYLMTARKNGLPVQFTLFAFLPEVLGGQNPYLDPDAVHRQQTLITRVVERFRDVPFLAWDIINEPSISQHLWRTRPNGDDVEKAQWNAWLKQRFPNQADLAAAWNEPNLAADVPVPTDAEFSLRSMYSGSNSLKLYDFYSFAQETFAAWARTMRDTIRATGSQQLITVGQDEGGYDDRLSPGFFSDSLDFVTNHTWWQNDSLLWSSLVAKQPGKPMLIQETGLQRELTLDEIMRRSTENEAALFERKMAMSFVQGSGAIEWLWNLNPYMANANESPIGAVRADGTEKPEARVMRAFAAFAQQARDHLRNPVRPSVAIVTSQAAQFSVLGNLQVQAQRNAVRALCYGAHVTAYVIAENQIAKLGSPRLAILPSPQALGERAWESLLQYVSDGGNLLITGPVHRDPYWRRVDRSRELLPGVVEPITYKNASLQLGKQTAEMTFNLQAQNWLEALRFERGTFAEAQRGKGRVFWASYPVELAEDVDAATKLYSYVLERVAITPAFVAVKPVPAGVLVYTTELNDAMLYLFESESADDHDLDLRDKATNLPLHFRLASQRAAIAVISKTTKQIVARYGF